MRRRMLELSTRVDRRRNPSAEQACRDQLVQAPTHEMNSRANSTAESATPQATAPTPNQTDLRLKLKMPAAASEQPAAIMSANGRFSFASEPHPGGNMASTPKEQTNAATAQIALASLDVIVIVRTAWLSTAARMA